MNLPRTLRVLLLCSLLAFIGHVPTGVGQVPAEDGPALLLTSTTDYGSLRSSLEELRSLSSSPITTTWIADLHFRKLLEAGSNQIYSGSYIRFDMPLWFGVSGAMPASMTRSARAFAYIHQVGQPCAIPPDSLFEGPTIDKLSRDRFERAQPIQLGVELDFVIYFLEQIEWGDPLNLMGPLVGYCNTGSNMALVDLEVSRTGSQIQLTLQYQDMLDLSAAPVAHTVAGVATATGFEQVTVQ